MSGEILGGELNTYKKIGPDDEEEVDARIPSPFWGRRVSVKFIEVGLAELDMHLKRIRARSEAT